MRTQDGLERRYVPEMLEKLTDRELQVLQMASDGLMTRQISKRLHISVSTVKGHFSRIQEKLGTANRAHSVAVAIHEGLLRGD